MSTGNESPQANETTRRQGQACQRLCCQSEMFGRQRENTHWDYSQRSEKISQVGVKGSGSSMFLVWHQLCRLLIISRLRPGNLQRQPRPGSGAEWMWRIMWQRINCLGGGVGFDSQGGMVSQYCLNTTPVKSQTLHTEVGFTLNLVPYQCHKFILCK